MTTSKIPSLSASDATQRLTLIGFPGAGKTTLARQLTKIFNVPHIELDAFYWESNWRRAHPDIFYQRVVEATSQKAWLLEGNYDSVSELIWRQANTLIWLDLPLPLLMRRLWQRTMRNLLTGRELWNGNREQWSRSFLTHRSIFLRLLVRYYPKRRAIRARLNDSRYAHLHVIHLRSPESVNRWVATHQLSPPQLSNHVIDKPFILLIAQFSSKSPLIFPLNTIEALN